ncbi:MAG: glycosyltransferase [Candidatus Korobacteraceae bacterium]
MTTTESRVDQKHGISQLLDDTTVQLSLAVLVPVYNEQYLVQTSLRRLWVLGQSPLLSRIKVIVVDDRSRDNTAGVLEQFQNSLREEKGDPKFEWVFLRHERNQGKGGAIRTALDHADTDLTVIHDADLEYHPRDLLQMIPVFVTEGADAVFGSRFLAGGFKRALFFRHSLGNHLLTFLSNLASDLNLTDMETCYKMVRTDVFRSIPLESRDFRIEPELTIKLAKRNARIFELPISYSGRTYQEGKKINWKDGVKALVAITRFALSDNISKQDRYGSEILARLRRAPRFTRWMADTIRPHVGDRVLEIGAGIGNLTLNLVPRTLYWASDINPMYLHELRKLEDTRPYLRSATIDLTDSTTFPPDEKFDTVVCLNVVEHVEDDLTALRNIKQVLTQDGRAIVLVPQGPSLFGSLDRVLGHYRRYRKDQLAALAREAGFHVREILEFNRSGVPAWWLNGKLLKRQTFGLMQIKVLNWMTPLFRKMDEWLPLPPLSLIAILERSAASETPVETRTQQAVRV